MSLIELMARYQLYNKEGKYWESLMSLRIAGAYASSLSTYYSCMSLLATLGVVNKEWYI